MTLAALVARPFTVFGARHTNWDCFPDRLPHLVGLARVTLPFLVSALLAFPAGCSLVTVPVKTAGSLAETTVKTSGTVAAAPFHAVGGRRDSQRKDAEDD